MTEQLPELQVRFRETVTEEGTTHSLEVWDGAHIVGRLPWTRVSYGLDLGETGELTVSLPVRRADVASA